MRGLFVVLLVYCALQVSVAQDNNMGFEVTDGMSMMDYYPSRNGTFTPGSLVLAYTNNYMEALPEEFKDKELICFYEVKLSDKVIHKHVFRTTCPTGSYFKINVIPDSYSSEHISFRKDWNGNFLRVLNALPKGTHRLQFSSYFELNNKRIKIGIGEINYDNTDPKGVDLLKMAADIDKNATFDHDKEMAEWIEKNGGQAAWRAANEADMQKSDAEDAKREKANYYAVTLKNNCNASYTVTVNDAQTYVIDGKGSAIAKIRRGTTGNIKVNNSVVATVNEKQENTIVTICK